MFQGQYLFQGDAVYSPWMPRGGDNLQFSVELIASNSGTLKVEVYSKNREQTGDGDLASNTNINVNSPDVYDARIISNGETGTMGLYELVRYKFTCSGTNNAHYVLFRMLDEVWFDSVNTSL